MNIILLGCPGAGKGTQAKILAEKYGLKHIATGDLFRAEIAAKTPLGLKVADYLKNGTLVPDGVVVEMVAGKLDGTNAAGYVLDGFPRTLEQAQALDGVLKKTAQRIDAVAYINMNEAEVVRRLTSRRSCAKCGALYNLLTKPPKTDGKCDSCGGDVVQREDDGESTVKKRLLVYNDLTAPLISFYKSELPFFELDGSQPIDSVTQALVSVIDGAKAGKA
jgi:adenylate kinase